MPQLPKNLSGFFALTLFNLHQQSESTFTRNEMMEEVLKTRRLRNYVYLK
jgi:hypothetical protein